MPYAFFSYMLFSLRTINLMFTILMPHAYHDASSCLPLLRLMTTADCTSLNTSLPHCRLIYYTLLPRVLYYINLTRLAL
jgi:hypothetical protein